MNENEQVNTITADEDVMFPEGWDPSLDFFGDWGEGPDQAGEAAPTPEQPQAGADEAEAAPTPEPAAPTTEQQTPPDVETPMSAEAPTTEPEAGKADSKLHFTANIDRNQVDVDLDPAELPTIYQKAANHDRMEGRYLESARKLEQVTDLALTLGYQSLDDMLESARSRYQESTAAGYVSKGLDPEVAADLAALKMSRAAAGPRQTAAPDKDSQGQAAQPDAGARDFGAEMRELMAERPELRAPRLPDEVLNAAIHGGKPLRAAYGEYLAKKEAAEAQRLQKENSILRQNAEASAKAPVRGTAGSGVNAAPQDDFLKGFLSD